MVIESDDDVPVQVPARSILDQALALAPSSKKRALNMMGRSDGDGNSFGSFPTIYLQSVFIDGKRSSTRSGNPHLKVHSRIAIYDGFAEMVSFQYTDVRCASVWNSCKQLTQLVL